ncbi:MAG: lipopolysaccharide biosynthesis protein [Thermoleophilaceae bacterium]
MNRQLLDAGRRRVTDRLPAARRLAASDTARAAGMALAVALMNVLALVFTVAFARILGASGYGSLAVLLSAFIILTVPGSALQIATAREISHAVADGEADPGSGVRLWLRHLGLATVAVAALAVPLREVIGSVLAVDDTWAAAAVPVSGMLWAVVCVERGALQGFQRYRLVGSSLVGEGVLRLVFALLLVAAGLDVVGAFLGTGTALVGVGLVLYGALRRDLTHGRPEGERGLRSLLRTSGVPVAGLTLLFALQEAHVIVVKHEVADDAAGSYAVAAVAAKGVIWVAVGLGMYLLPEASRRARAGEDAKPVLLTTLGLIAVIGAPMVVVYAVAAGPLLAAVFGDDLTGATGALPWLGLAMTFLACSYLCVQYLLALGHRRFIAILGLAALADVALLAAIGSNLTHVAIALCTLQAACAIPLFGVCLRAKPERPIAFLPV